MNPEHYHLNFPKNNFYFMIFIYFKLINFQYFLTFSHIKFIHHHLYYLILFYRELIRFNYFFDYLRIY